MNIVEAIKDLLYKYDCVIIPEFGGIIANYQSAVIHPIKSTFDAPSKRLAFNESLQENDGLLVNHLIQRSNNSSEEVLKQIHLFVLNTRRTIESEGSITLDGIGVFAYNSEQKIQFKAVTDTNYLEDSFGLSNLYFKPVTREENKTNMQQIHSSSSPQKPVPPRRPAKKVKEEAPKKESGKIIYLLIPILLVIGSAAFMFIKKDVNGDPLMASFIPSLKTDTTAVMDEDIDAASLEDELVSDEISDEEGTVEEHSDHDDWGHEEDHSVTSETGNYHIIAGVFSSRSNANKLANAHHGEVLEIDGYYKVSVGRFDTKNAADEEKAHLSSDLGNDIWVLEQ